MNEFSFADEVAAVHAAYDDSWRQILCQAQQEIDSDIDDALLRVATNSSLADAILLAGYLNRGHLFDKHTERCPTHQEDENE